MVAHASGQNPTSDDGHDGALFGIRRPDDERKWLAPLDSRPYSNPGQADIASQLSTEVHWYRAPDISERLRIQRGSFLVGPLVAAGEVTFPLNWSSKPAARWLRKRVAGLGKAGQPVKAQTDVIVFRVDGTLKGEVREWLRDRAGLIQEVIYPTPWHKPYLEEFCRAYGRSRPVDLP